MVKKKLIYHPDTQLYEYEGTFFDFKKVKYKKIGKVKHEDIHIYEEVNVDKVDKLRKEISKKLKDNVDPERVLEEALKVLNEKGLKKLKEQLNDKKTKVTAHDGCYGLEIDTGKKNSGYLELFG